MKFKITKSVEMRAEATSLSRIFNGILRSETVIPVSWIKPEEGIGYSTDTPKKGIFIAYEHPFFEAMKPEEYPIARMAIGVHECLHLAYTNFKYTYDILSKYEPLEQGILMNFLNALEDPAIEYQAPLLFGGTPLKALRWFIKYTHEQSKPINEAKTAYSQLVAALIFFGDMGIVKGEFTFPEAKETFTKVAPLFNEGVTCMDAKKRLDIGEQIFLMCRPLWEEEKKREEEMRKFMEELAKTILHMSDKAKGSESTKGASRSACETSSSKRRKKAAEEMSEPCSGSGSKGDDDESIDSASESSKKSGSSSKDKSDSKEDSKDSSDESTGGGSSKSSSDDSDDSDDSEKSEGSTSDGTEGGSEKGDEGTEGDSSKDKSSEGDSSESDDSGEPDDTTSTDDNSESDADSEEDCDSEDDDIDSEELSDDILERIVKEAEASAKAESEESDGTECESISGYCPSTTFYDCKSIKVYNGLVKKDGYCENEYAKLVSNYSWVIKKLTKDFEKIFAPEMESGYRATSGSYNIMRGAVGTTARIFDKRKTPDGKKDVAVLLLVDNSGSMSSKISSTIAATAILQEALTNVKVPLAVMGFTADTKAEGRRYEAVHRHFVSFDDVSNKNRSSIIYMRAECENFDGYSIRYATEMLKARPESNKVLMIISDGQPACGRYYEGRANGNADVTEAVREAKKCANVFGIGIGRCSPTVLITYYGKDFIHCPNLENLPNLLAKEMTKVLDKVVNK